VSYYEVRKKKERERERENKMMEKLRFSKYKIVQGSPDFHSPSK
jgi:hypothetical protein